MATATSIPSQKPVSMSSREWLWIQEGKKCHWCGMPTLLCRVQQNNQATIDHVISRGKGGPDTFENCVSSCHFCNQRRNSECMKGLPEGALLKGWDCRVGGSLKPVLVSAKPKVPPDIKSVEYQLRTQRDQALAEIRKLRKQLEDAHSELSAVSAAQVQSGTSRKERRERVEAMTLRQYVAMRLRRWVFKEAM